MKREQKLEAIRQKCIEANPEILGGHQFYVGDHKCVYCGEKRYVVDRQAKNILMDEKTGGKVDEVTYTRHDMTKAPCPNHFSRPVRLADVLLAVKRFAWDVSTGQERNDRFLDAAYKWDLRADDLTAQSDETIDFLYDLLK